MSISLTGSTSSHGSWQAAPPAMSSAWVSDIGHRRTRQEDRAAAGANFVVIADGVGSVPGGGDAAQVAVGHFSARIAGARSQHDVAAAFQDTHELIIRLAGAGLLPADCATTLTAAVQLADSLLIANVGDSPGWVIEAPGPRSVVRLHRRWDPFRESFVLLSALGSADYAGPAFTTITAAGPTRLVLASDGIIDDPADPDPPPVLALAREGEPAGAARRIAAAVLRGPAADNLTVAVIDVGPAEGK